MSARQASVATGSGGCWVKRLSSILVVACTCFVVVLAQSDAATAQTASFTPNATSAPPGTTIVLTSVTPCKLPAGVTGSPLIRVTITRSGDVLGSGSAAVSGDGTWTASLVIHPDAAPGTSVLSATCLASAQAEGSLLNYDPLAFTITEPGTLARTGVRSNALGVAGAVTVILGLALAVAPRPRRRP
jgi:hypothetical protein